MLFLLAMERLHKLF
jgi:hypothetical protein